MSEIDQALEKLERALDDVHTPKAITLIYEVKKILEKLKDK